MESLRKKTDRERSGRKREKGTHCERREIE